MFSRRGFLAGATVAAGAPAWLASAAASFAAAAANAPVLDEFVRAPAFSDAALSPNGAKVALLGEIGQDASRRTIITVMDASLDPASVKRIDIADHDVRWILWANDERLLALVEIPIRARARRQGSRAASDIDTDVKAQRVISIGIDGSRPATLFENHVAAMRRGVNVGDIVDLSYNDPDHVLMTMWGPNRLELYRVNVYSGAATMIEQGGDWTIGFETLQGAPVLRYDINRRGTAMRVMGREPGGRSWDQIVEVRREDLHGFNFVSGTEEAGVFLVHMRLEGEETSVVRKYDMRTKTFGDIVAQRPDADVTSALVDHAGRFIGAGYVDDRIRYEFNDRVLTAHFRALDGFFDRSANVRIYEASADNKRFLLKVTGPKDAGSFHLYDVEGTNLQALCVMRPWLTPDRLASVETLKVKTRDGAEITAYLTVPAGQAAGPRPLIVMPHGGPESRDMYDYDLWAQVLAAKGWLVLQPNFRGSGSLGRKFAEAGQRQWGGRMQDDVTDAVQQIVADGRADPARLGIFGWSYGGYSALMGAIKTPDLYKGAVAGAPVTDLPMLLNHTRMEDGAQSETYRYLVRWIGDPSADAAAIEAVSPAHRAGEIKIPVMIIHGDADDIVPVSHGRRMHDALKRAGVAVGYHEYEDEGHSFHKREDTADYLGKIVAFFEQVLA